MSYTFLDLQNEVKARAILDQSGTTFDTRIKNTINTSLFRVARECKWRVLRRKSTFDTIAPYTEGTGAVTVTNDSKAVTITGATLLTDGVTIGRKIELGGSSLNYFIDKITGETTLELDRVYDGTTSATQSYKIYGKEEYSLLLQTNKIDLLWHEDYGYPYVMRYVTDTDFYGSSTALNNGNTPTVYRQYTYNGSINQIKNSGVVSVVSSSASDTAVNIIVKGTIGGYPDSETITTNGTTTSNGSKTFDAGSIKQVIKESTSVGRITVTADSGNTTISVIPVGDTMGQTQFIKVQLFPFPTRIFPVHVGYYEMPSRLVDNSDMHVMGSDFDEAIILLTASKLAYGQGKGTAGDNFLKLYLDEIKNLRKSNSDTLLDWFPSLRKPASRFGHTLKPHEYLSYGQLGGYYGPAGL